MSKSFSVFSLTGAFLALFVVFGPAKSFGQDSVSPVEFNDQYISENSGKQVFLTPPAFELANIILSLSPMGTEGPLAVFKETEYYKKVQTHFEGFRDHPLFAELKFEENPYRYLSLRENSSHYGFENGKIVKLTPYPYHWFGLEEVTSLLGNQPDTFAELLPLIEDFASKSGFLKFYQENKSFYNEQKRTFGELAPLAEMIQWLDREFPSGGYNTYKVFFSPLINSTHSSHHAEGNNFKEALMYLPAPVYVKTKSDGNSLTQEEQSAKLSRMLFTEVDHPYINPVSDKYENLMGEIFVDLSAWNGQGEGTPYFTPYQTLNEYMTWGVFVLWAREKYSEALFQTAKKDAEEFMVKRKFTLFPSFTETLLRIYREREPGQTLESLYPKVLQEIKALGPKP